MLESNVIRPYNSPKSCPIILIQKPYGVSWRFCVDYQKLNAVTKKDSYPLPKIDDTLDRLKESRYFSCLDMDQAYYQVELAEEDKNKSFFVTSDGMYEFNVMPFGLCNAPATFQRLIASVLGQLKWSMALVYLDDIRIFSKSFEDHLSHLGQIF